MAEDTREFEDLLRIDREHGRIHYGDERFLLVSAEAIGKLRRELYEVLGPIMAHELLFRFGFHDGTKAARTIRGRFPELSHREMLEAGPGIHMLEGMVEVHLTDLDLNGDDLRRIAGEWRGSFEADQEIEEWGQVEWTTCWVLTGFASGFASEVLDRDFLCVEQSCRARGDPTCSFEILPADSFPGLARKVRALRAGLKLSDRMQTTLSRLSEKAFKSAAFLSRILTDSADAILTVDEDEIIRTWNRGAEELLGYRASEAIGHHFSFLVPPDLLERGEIETIRAETVAKGSLRNYGTRRLRKDGEEIDVSLTRTAIQDVHGTYVGCSAILRDITERKKLVQKLIQVESLAEIGELAAQVAHEIKNPLAGISAAVQILAETVPRDDPRSGVFLEVLEHVHRLDETVLSLLRFTRPYVPDRRRTSVEETVDAALSMLEKAEDFREVEVRRELAPEAKEVLADSQQLVQVLMNLLLNGAQALRDDRTLIVRSGMDDGFAFIEVEDHGVGIPAAQRNRIFRPFFTSRNKGTGLGLPIARKIVEGHGGNIEVFSEPGRGARFRVRLPTEEASGRETPGSG